MSSLLDDFLGQSVESSRLRVIVDISNVAVRQYWLLLDGGTARALTVDRSLVHGL